jgi:hypothetical protein
MKTNEIKTAVLVQKEDNNGVFTLNFKMAPGTKESDYDLDQIGCEVMSSGVEGINKNYLWVTAISSPLLRGDSITTEKGGEPIIAEVHGATVKKEVFNPQPYEGGYEDVFKKNKGYRG